MHDKYDDLMRHMCFDIQKYKACSPAFPAVACLRSSNPYCSRNMPTNAYQWASVTKSLAAYQMYTNILLSRRP